MISRLFLATASVVASVGLLFYGMATSYSPKKDGLETLGLVMLIGGVVAILVGIVWYRQSEKVLEDELERTYGPGRND